MRESWILSRKVPPAADPSVGLPAQNHVGGLAVPRSCSQGQRQIRLEFSAGHVLIVVMQAHLSVLSLPFFQASPAASRQISAHSDSIVTRDTQAAAGHSQFGRPVPNSPSSPPRSISLWPRGSPGVTQGTLLRPVCIAPAPRHPDRPSVRCAPWTLVTTLPRKKAAPNATYFTTRNAPQSYQLPEGERALSLKSLPVSPTASALSPPRAPLKTSPCYGPEAGNAPISSLDQVLLPLLLSVQS